MTAPGSIRHVDSVINIFGLELDKHKLLKRAAIVAAGIALAVLASSVFLFTTAALAGQLTINSIITYNT